jgi:putative photosynthetic complex assembly protein 2
LLTVLYVIAAWWGATGLILYLVRRPHRTFAGTLSIASAVLLLGLVLLRAASHSATVAGASLAFGATLLIWGWLEISFLVGAVTGPRRVACPADCGGVAHFGHAVGAILYHELATIAAAALVLLLTWRLPNQVGLWTFLLLWGMRISAKLNLFLGVPNTGEIMLPPHLKYLGGFFRRRRLNLLLPVSITLATALCVVLITAALSVPSGSFDASAVTLLATLASLALLEHCMLVLPMRADAPWRLTRTLSALRTAFSRS